MEIYSILIIFVPIYEFIRHLIFNILIQQYSMHNIYKEVGSDLGKNIPAHKLETTRQAINSVMIQKQAGISIIKLSIYYSFGCRNHIEDRY